MNIARFGRNMVLDKIIWVGTVLMYDFSKTRVSSSMVLEYVVLSTQSKASAKKYVCVWSYTTATRPQ